jgi:DNA-binding NarL/FixJ family response regulator
MSELPCFRQLLDDGLSYCVPSLTVTCDSSCGRANDGRLQAHFRLGRLDPGETMAIRPRILIADDQRLVAELFRRLLGDDFDVVGCVGDGHALVRAAVELKPNLILVDIAMPLLNGLDAGRQVKKMLPTVKLIYLTMTADADVAAEAFGLGASGYLLKTCDPDELVLAVREALRGQTYLSIGMSPEIIESIRWERKECVKDQERLSDRQREVLQLLAEGKTMKEIGGTLYISKRTVQFHKYDMMKRLGAKSTAELVRYAVKHHIVAA